MWRTSHFGFKSNAWFSLDFINFNWVEVFAWGYNNKGQLGLKDAHQVSAWCDLFMQQIVLTPTLIEGLKTAEITQISAGNLHSAGLSGIDYEISLKLQPVARSTHGVPMTLDNLEENELVMNPLKSKTL